MRLLEDRILSEAVVLPGDVPKVGSFLNQQIDTELLREMAEEVARLFADSGVTKIMTIESSGIPLACAVGMVMGVPVVFAKKHRTSNVDGSVYQTIVHSFTHNTNYNIVVSRDYLTRRHKVLLVDDFLANGKALRGLVELVECAGARLAGAAVAIEKCFSGEGDWLRRIGVRIESLAAIESMADGEIVFRP